MPTPRSLRVSAVFCAALLLRRSPPASTQTPLPTAHSASGCPPLRVSPTGTQAADRLTVCYHCWGPGPGDSQLPTAPCYGKVGLCFLGLVPKRKCILGCWAVPGPAARSVGTSTALPEDGSEGQLSCSCHHRGSFLLPEPAMWRSR